MAQDDGTGERTSSAPASPIGRLLNTLIGVAMAPLFLVIFASGPACFGFEEPTLRAIEACPAAVEALGTPIARGWLGLSCGNASTHGDRGHASWTFPVVGPNGRGSVNVATRERDGVWQFGRVELEVNGRTIDVLHCGTAMPEEFSSLVHATHSSHVVSVLGAPGVSVGEACSSEVGPSDDDSHSCRVQVLCGARALYGGPRQGYTNCVVTPDGVMAHDASMSEADGDPALDLHTGRGEITVSDRNEQGMWAVVVRFDDAPTPAVTPNPPEPATPTPTPNEPPTPAAAEPPVPGGGPRS
jgi:hypothetical protein